MSDWYDLLPDGTLVPIDIFSMGRGDHVAPRLRFHLDTTVFGNRISTVFLGLDHSWNGGPPVVFETMVFGGPLDEEQDRYCTRAEAEAGHAMWVARVCREHRIDRRLLRAARECAATLRRVMRGGRS